jgi:hypothetical protein
MDELLGNEKAGLLLGSSGKEGVGKFVENSQGNACEIFHDKW